MSLVTGHCQWLTERVWTSLVPVHQSLGGVSFSFVVSPPSGSACIEIIRVWGTVSWRVTITEWKFISDVRTSRWRNCLNEFRCCHWWLVCLWYSRLCKNGWSNCRVRVRCYSWLWSNSCIPYIVVGGICRWNIWWLNQIWTLIILVVFTCLMHLMIVSNRESIGSTISFFANYILVRVIHSYKKNFWDCPTRNCKVVILLINFKLIHS